MFKFHPTNECASHQTLSKSPSLWTVQISFYCLQFLLWHKAVGNFEACFRLFLGQRHFFFFLKLARASLLREDICFFSDWHRPLTLHKRLPPPSALLGGKKPIWKANNIIRIPTSFTYFVIREWELIFKCGTVVLQLLESHETDRRWCNMLERYAGRPIFPLFQSGCAKRIDAIDLSQCQSTALFISFWTVCFIRSRVKTIIILFKVL